MTILKRLGLSRSNQRLVLCRCECGVEFISQLNNVNSRNTISCGCYSTERIKALRWKHGMYKTKEFKIWMAMRQRCYDQKNRHYEDYGGRGISVCDRWLDFKNFHADMGNRPSKDHQIERKNNSLGYSPDNCKWALRIEQANNKRNNVFHTHDGLTLTEAQWCRRLGFKNTTAVWKRLRRGWDLARALTTPPQNNNFKLPAASQSPPASASCKG